jgi:cell division protein ZapA (FtsZ GTPase activity inhibitor)
VAQQHTVTLEIAGARYRMTSDAEPTHLSRLAEMVNERVDQLGSRAARQASPAQLLAVVALGLADDLLQAEKRASHIEDATRRAIGSALERIEQRLEADGPTTDGI